MTTRSTAAELHGPDHRLRDDLIHRRHLLESARSAGGGAEIRRLLDEVDEALRRMDQGDLGSCRVCGGAVEAELLGADPLRRVCLECLSSVERRALEIDLALAADFQGALTPRGELRLPGWHAYVHSRAAGTVGGDFVDLVEAPDDGGVRFVVGDVSGKGISAALLASHLQALFRAVVALPGSLTSRVARVNRMFSSVTPTQAFATMVWGQIDGSGRGELVNAGHPPALVVGRRGCRRVESTGVPVGLFASARYESSSFELSPGEQLVVVTDGVTESADGDDREYGVDGLWTMVSQRDLEVGPEQAAARYLDDVVRHRAGGPQHDDLTLLVLRRACCVAAPEPADHRVS